MFTLRAIGYILSLMRYPKGSGTKKHPALIEFEANVFEILEYLRSRTGLSRKQIVRRSVLASESMILRKFSELKTPSLNEVVDVDADVVAAGLSNGRT